MYLHIGSGFVVRNADIVGIFDLDNMSYERRSREYLRHAEQAGRVVNASEDLPRSVVITSGENYLSGISSRTLAKRFFDGLE